MLKLFTIIFINSIDSWMTIHDMKYASESRYYIVLVCLLLK